MNDHGRRCGRRVEANQRRLALSQLRIKQPRRSGAVHITQGLVVVVPLQGIQPLNLKQKLGPAGLAYEGATDTLYVAAEVDNAIFKVTNASTRSVAANKGTVFFSGTPLRGPVGLVLAPNGHVLASNSDAVNGDPTYGCAFKGTRRSGPILNVGVH
jgi:hypothetical protein